jgi:hypothetical protein
MMNSGISSIQRAATLLSRSGDHENFVIIKLEPEPRSCCCFHCWPMTWSAINHQIAPSGPIKDEADVLIKRDDHEFVLECHESGPEIVVYLGLTTALVVLVKSVVDLITVFVKALQDEPHKSPAKIKIVRRQIIDTNEDEVLLELDLPLSEDITDVLNNKVREALQRSAKPPGRKRGHH